MAWSAPPYTGGVLWQDLPSHLTPVNAADLNTEENAEAAYAAQVGQSIANRYEARTFLSVMDSEYGAKGDGTTDDSAAVQAAINAASTLAGGSGYVDVVLASGHTFVLHDLVPKNNVRVWAFGATIKLGAGATNGIFWQNSSPLPRFGLRGGYFAGTGSETANQNVFALQSSSGGGTDIGIFDIEVVGWGTAPIWLGDVTRARVCRNTFVSCNGSASNLNCIDIVTTHPTSQALTEVIVTENVIDGYANGHGIGIINTGNTNNLTVKGIVSHNTVSVSAGVGIAVEWSNTTQGEASTLTIESNHVVYTGASSSLGGIEVAAAGPTTSDPLLLSRIVIAHNTVDSTQQGIHSTASNAVITENYVTATTGYAIRCEGAGTFAATGTTTNASNQVTGVTAPAGIQNGMPVSGTNIPGGTFLVSGAGTATWTLSQNATGANAGLTVFASISNVTVAHNIVHSAASPANPIIQLSAVRSSIVQGNHAVVDSGSATTTGIGINLGRCGWCDVLDNFVEYAAGYGISVQNSNDFRILRNRIYNPSDGGSLEGINFAALSGTVYLVADNAVVDDRATHKMLYGVSTNHTGAVGVVELLRNELLGAATAPTNGTFARRRDNVLSTGASEGRATLVAGTVTVSTAEIQAGDSVILTRVSAGGTVGVIQLGTITAGTSFVINSVQPGTASTLQAADTSTVYWRIDH